MRAGRLRQWCVNLALLFAATALSLAIALGAFVLVSEHRLRSDTNFHDPNTRFDPELGWAPIPRRSVETWGGVHVSSDANGLRSPEVDRSRGHVLIVGDSVVWGYKVGDHQTVSRHLQAMLDGERRGLQVLNLGVSGYGIDQYYLWLRRKLDEIPSVRAIVVVVTAANDWGNTGANHAYGKSKPLFELGPGGELRNLNERISEYSLLNLTSEWRLPRPVRRHLERFYDKREVPEPQRREVVRALFVKIRALAESRQASLLFVISPHTGDLGANESAELRLFRELLAAAGERPLDFKEFLLRRARDPRKAYRDPVHLSPAGHRLLAEAILQRLDPTSL